MKDINLSSYFMSVNPQKEYTQMSQAPQESSRIEMI
jgi:hypothetical protein